MFRTLLGLAICCTACGNSGVIRASGHSTASSSGSGSGSASSTGGVTTAATSGTTTTGHAASTSGRTSGHPSSSAGTAGATHGASSSSGASSASSSGTAVGTGTASTTSSTTSASTSAGSTASTGSGTTASSSSGGLLPDAGPAGYTLIFDDELDRLSLEPNSACFGSVPTPCDGGGTWLPLYTWNNRTLSGNDEAEIYVDPTYAGSGAGCTTPLGLDPFSIDAGVLTLSANPTPAADLACLGNLPYTSGAIISYPSFSTVYGYFEARVKLPAGQGLWPAFWLLDENLQWPPEIDIFEFVDVDGGQPSTLQMHTHDSDATYAFGAATQVPNVSQDFHVYAVDWEPDTITWYFDGVQQAQTTTAPDLNQPMYILLNLAVGGTGSWPGPTDSSTVFPANMQIDYVRVWQKQ